MKTQIKTQQKEAYKETELGLLPNEWNVACLADDTFFGILRSGIKKFDGTKDYLSTSSIELNNILGIEAKITYDDRPSRANMQPILNSVWLAKMKNTIKVYSFTDKNKDEVNKFILSTGFAGIACDKFKVFPEYLNQLFLSSWFNSIKDAAAHGSTQQAINNDDIKKFLIPIPQLPEQRNIAFVLSSIREAKEKTGAVVSSLRETKKSLMKYLFTYGPVSIEEAENVELKESELGKIPQHWKVLKLGVLISEGPQNGIYKPQTLYGRGTKIVRIEDFPNEGRIITDVDSRVELTEKEIDKYCLLPDDLIINRVNSLSHIGKVALIGNLSEPIVFESNMMRFKVNSYKILPEFAYIFLSSPFGREQMKSKAKRAVAQSSINQGDVKSSVVALPELAIQQQMAASVMGIDARIEAEQNKANALGELFNSMLRDLMTAKIRVKDLVVANG